MIQFNTDKRGFLTQNEWLSKSSFSKSYEGNTDVAVKLLFLNCRYRSPAMTWQFRATKVLSSRVSLIPRLRKSLFKSEERGWGMFMCTSFASEPSMYPYRVNDILRLLYIFSPQDQQGGPSIGENALWYEGERRQ
jgi:hypothetical protein